VLLIPVEWVTTAKARSRKVPQRILSGPSRRCALAVNTRSLYEAIAVLLTIQFSISTCPRAPVALKGPTAQSITAAFFKQQSIPKKPSRSFASLRLGGGYPLSLRSHHCAASYPIQHLHLPARTRSPKGPNRTIHHSCFLQAAEYSKKNLRGPSRRCGFAVVTRSLYEAITVLLATQFSLPARTRSPKGPNRTIHHSRFLQAAEYSKKIFAVLRVVAPLRWLPALSTKPSLCC